MMRILAIANIKGGVGKTTTTVNLSAALAERGCRVLAIDLDPQSSLTASLSVAQGAARRTICDAFSSHAVPLASLAVRTPEGFDLVASSHELRSVEHELDGDNVRPFFLKDLLAPLEERYDYVLIDCPANAGILTGNALAAATDVIIPFPPDYLALKTLDWLLQVIRQVREQLNPGLRVAGFLLAMYTPGTHYARDVIMAARHQYGIEIPFFSAAIRLDDGLRMAPGTHQSALRYAPESSSARSYRRLAEEIEAGVHEPAPLDAISAIRRARKELEKGDRHSAYRYFSLATQVDERNLSAWAGRAGAAPDELEAIRCWAKAAQLDPSSDRFHVELGSHISSLLGRHPSPDTRELMALGQYLLEAGHRLYSGLIFRFVTQMQQENAAAWLGLARSADNNLAALSYCLQALALSPGDPSATAEREVLLCRVKSEAEELVRKAVETAGRGDKGEAHRLFRRAAELNPENERAWLGCARTCDDEEMALAFAKKVLEVNPQSSEGLNLYHWLYVPPDTAPLRSWRWPGLLALVLAVAAVSALLVLFQHFAR